MDVNSNTNTNRDASRATILAFSDASRVNEYTLASSFTEASRISMEHNRRLIDDIVDKVFDERRGTCEKSSSQCSSLKLKSSKNSYDKRLKYWKNVLKEREKISRKIQEHTKKNHSDILYNRLVTVDERDKFTVKNLMDYAERLNPTKVTLRKINVLPEKCNTELLTLIPELRETLPLTERIKRGHVEITGLPKEIQKELLGKQTFKSGKKIATWLNSEYLEQRVDEKRDDIERVLEYYPDIENLQIVGEGLLHPKPIKRKSDINVMTGSDICEISSDTPVERFEEITSSRKDIVKTYEFVIKINDQDYVITKNPCNTSIQASTNFTCFPFETEIQRIFTVQNIGKKVLDFHWVFSSFYYKNSTLLKSHDNEFVFDNLPFRLCSGDTQEIFVKFQPRKVSVVKSKWILKVKPCLFARKADGIVMQLCGECRAPLEYVQKVDDIKREVIAKSNQQMVKSLTSNLSALATELQPPDCNCPYQRSLNEMEIFEELNEGFKCERFHDLELLKELYKRAKKPRDKLWDLQVKTLKNTILRIPQSETRALLFNELCGILHSMKGSTVDLEIKMADNKEKDRNRFLYVRGIVSTLLEEFVNLALTLEETFYQTILQVIQKEGEEMEEEGSNEGNLLILFLPEDEAEKRQYLLEKRVRKLKPYRDTLYMQTYTLLCDFVENIVNVIESNL